ncbi:hypothetical protein BJ508DRAFT_326440 [Ascobolus immersus RN42]|uniref:Uncharacterized protein n=1 Tax=Ascobolus immersus RN42 TaxID=1160509 RepID=A0A3N4IAZ0_ASCIM|nr:hypothetical protein BJ508DRAFT_326440 [Ascobolus immersus RN42]
MDPLLEKEIAAINAVEHMDYDDAMKARFGYGDICKDLKMDQRMSSRLKMKI